MRKLLILVLLSTLSFASLADEAAKRNTVNEIMEAMQIQKTLDAMTSHMDKMFIQMAKDIGLKESEMPVFEKYMKQVSHVMETELTWEKMKKPMTDIYVKHYTEKELNDILVFYKSDTGMKLIEKMPLVAQESMMVSQSMMKDLMPKIINLSKQLRQEVKIARNE